MTTPRRTRFPLPLDAVVERKPAPERTAGMPAIDAARKAAVPIVPAAQTPPNALKPLSSAITASAMQRGRKPALSSTPQPVAPGSAVEARTSAATAGGGGMASDRARGALTARLRASGIRDERVLRAIGTVPRHLFMEPGLASQAYEDAALPIGHQQTISKPSVVARMIELLREGLPPDQPLARVLEIGTGCGYQAAVLSLAAEEVFSIERIRPLHEQAKANLRPLRLPNVRLHYGDGMLGLPQAAPFSSIILAAAGMEVPEALLEQLAIGGRLIAPVAVPAGAGGQGGAQQLLLIERLNRHRFHRTALEAVFFVPLKSGTI
ncbi:protein-L-isoaspartate(D-aspartate) O-methyltransferase [Cupriavidus plantarum]|uniref:Protein-L-isoaspartate O-methyltransferase n=1 Tax=Cupriavidus plantarum TaxID=942865 RepID=A0A316EXI4_9BURK|nr:protein-L-isoaspartate(D-aspartate) O-methyltransferase [Cupriavidus plantarum]PWK36936.1 protein-L-isoaspartate(D-aspartate) O-methyltransferase [Cupriavidus plantarum]REF02325.1 protein-L-isoaspartate(D-aspartate) O-methyltransferase [Cupriavidus plantarum]RLK44820.1 protein-L-isoaspartate(D-aspartate) O-methyltransferase [Cupriavidus plantarum]CAG2152039.1 Protein-L-isoaspartate O-methyltransferase [Cupriavidus plantarum]SMR66019.1 protein-L-isoaspartate(D-aspartate) O-methyltransferase 